MSTKTKTQFAKNSEIVQGLRAAGRQVRIYHQREKREIWVDASSTCRVLEEQVSPKGGSTIVEIRYPDGAFKSGMACCRSDEAYNKKLGVAIALKRALNDQELKLCRSIDAVRRITQTYDDIPF